MIYSTESCFDVCFFRKKSIGNKTIKILAISVFCMNNALSAEINFQDFSNISDQALFDTNGSASFVGNLLRLTPNSSSQTGSAFLNQGQFIQSTADFSSAFQFKIDSPSNPTYLRSDGLAFLIQNYGSNYLGSGGGDLGYMNGQALSSSQYVYAIEFDIHQGSGDLSDNEIAITELTAAGKLTIANVNLNLLGIPLLDNGNVKNVLIEYGFNNQDYLKVFLSEGVSVPQLVLQTLLPTGHELFRSGGASTYLGFSAGTGGGYANHDILNWRVSIPEPNTLYLIGVSWLALLSVCFKSSKRPNWQ